MSAVSTPRNKLAAHSFSTAHNGPGVTSKRLHSHHQYKTTNNNGGNKPKYTTRHLAALDFLLTIPMKNEAKIRENGLLNTARIQAMEGLNGPMKKYDESGGDGLEGIVGDDSKKPVPYDNTLNADGLSESEALALSIYDEKNVQQGDAAGRKLQGIPANTVKMPGSFRYQVHRITEQSAVIRHWEDQLLSKGQLQNSRLFFSRARGYPSAVFSVIKYDAGEEKARIERLKADDQKGMEVFELPKRDWRGCSYKPLFKPLSEERKADYYFEQGYLYDPNIIDDPDFMHGSELFKLPINVLTGPLICSVISYDNKLQLKEKLNEQYRERHPHLPPSLTLSKIRNLKAKTIKMCLDLEIEISTVAIAIICFERLVMQSKVTKANRKLAMGKQIIQLFYHF